MTDPDTYSNLIVAEGVISLAGFVLLVVGAGWLTACGAALLVIGTRRIAH